MTEAKDIVDQLGQLKSQRTHWERTWTEISQRILPSQDDFNRTKQPGEQRTDMILEGSPQMSLMRFAAIVESLITPRSQTWHNLMPSVKELREIPRVKQWFEDLNETLFRYRYNSKANFASQQNETYISLGAFGTGVLFIDDWPGQGIRYKSCPIKQIYIMENNVGQIDTLYRNFHLTAKQCVDEFGEDDISPRMKKSMESNKPGELHELVHCVKPNKGYNPRVQSPDAMRFSSTYVSVDDRHILSKGGYRTFPYSTSRYMTASDEKYGRSPAMMVLPELKMINEMARVTIKSAHQHIAPSVLTYDDGVLQAFKLRPNSMIRGGLDSQGRELVKPLQLGGKVQFGENEIEKRREMIDDAFLITLFQILIDSPRMTATEVLQRTQEKGALVSPTMGRLQSESLHPMIEREIDILVENNLIDEMPGELLEAEGEYTIEYSSPLSRAQKAEEALGTERTVASLMEKAQLTGDMSIVDPINWDEYRKIIGEANGAPSRLFHEEEVYQQKAEQRLQAQQAQAIASAAPGVASAMKDLSEVQNAE
jgi:hypothetical protein